MIELKNLSKIYDNGKTRVEAVKDIKSHYRRLEIYLA